MSYADRGIGREISGYVDNYCDSTVGMEIDKCRAIIGELNV